MAKKIKKYKLPEEIIGEMKVLSTINIPSKIKLKLRKEAKRWLEYIKLHSEDMHKDDGIDNMYHKGEMSFIEFFFFFRPKIKKMKRLKKKSR